MAWSIAQKFSPRQSGAIRSEPLGATAGTKSRVRTLMAAVPRVERAVQQARFTISDQPGSHGGIRTRVSGALPDQGGHVSPPTPGRRSVIKGSIRQETSNSNSADWEETDGSDSSAKAASALRRRGDGGEDRRDCRDP